MIKQAVTVTDQEIIIRAEYFCQTNNTCAHKDILADIFSTKYLGQKIRVRANDGENLIATGLLTLIYEFCQILEIPPESVTIETHDTKLTQPFEFEHLPLGIFLGANKFIPKFEKNLVADKFVGIAIGRFTLERFRLAYEIDQAFPEDNYIIFQGRVWSNSQPFEELYTKEIEWFNHAKFKHDIKNPSPVGSIGFEEAYKNYPNIWNQYQIEIVSETEIGRAHV